jgi:hypothetical protein
MKRFALIVWMACTACFEPRMNTNGYGFEQEKTKETEPAARNREWMPTDANHFKDPKARQNCRTLNFEL